jgi:hypothetical protein
MSQNESSPSSEVHNSVTTQLSELTTKAERGVPMEQDINPSTGKEPAPPEAKESQ